MQPLFSIGDAVSYGWGMTKKHFGFLVLFTLGFFIINVILGMASEAEEIPILYKMLNVIVNYIGMFIFFRMGLMVYKGGDLQLSEVLDIDWRIFWLYFLSSILTLLATLAGFILLVLPAIYIGVRLSFASFALIDENLGPVDSLKRSWYLTRGHFWNLLGFSIVLGLINLVGFILLGVGLLVSTPLCLIASVYVYHKLKGALAVAPTAPAPVV